MNTLITICARAGSKRLPGKNIKIFNGKPLIEWTLIQALDFQKKVLPYASVGICTDYDDISSWYSKYASRSILFNRPARLSGNNIPKLEVIRWCRQLINYDIIIDLDVTAPLRLPNDIEKAYNQFLKHIPPTLFSAVPSRRKPWFNQIQVMNDGIRLVCPKETKNHMVPVFDLNASIYIYGRQWLNEGISHPVCPDSQIYVMQDWQFCDIDEPVDFQIAEFLHRKYILEK